VPVTEGIMVGEGGVGVLIEVNPVSLSLKNGQVIELSILNISVFSVLNLLFNDDIKV
jgi:hypothetical protein